ncbi:hypothetical protein BD289DRAFT_410634 [Coniella lustricola]|uniref:Carrier domain-containing protein n=1 Tax=Coniella lustricola TaxID=2025994 RepID=A0A2T3A639_9PEZI|nr:hypothetical protein BD289DRAFT_410634 [Coniella lustricola]
MNGTTPRVRPFAKAKVNFVSTERVPDCLHSLPELVDYNAIHNADHTFCVQGKPGGQFDYFSHADFKIAVANCAEWIRSNVPLKELTGSDAMSKMAPVALFMQSDYGLVVHEFALLSLGIPPLVLSPRLPPVAIMHLLQVTSASALIVSERLSEPAKPALAILNSKGISTHVALPYNSFHEPGADVKTKGVFPPPQELDSVILLLHSSGTTGLPKPITLTHRNLLFAVNCHGFKTEEEAQALNASTLPLFHGFGLVAPGLSMSAGKPTVYPSTEGIPNAASIIDMIKRSKARSLMTVPFLLDDMVNDPEAVRVLASLDFVGTGGAMLGAGVGDRLAQEGVKLLNFYGTTETGPLSDTFVPKDGYDWKYFRMRSDVNFKIHELAPAEDGERRFRLTVFPYGGTEGIEIADQLIRNENFPETDFSAVGRDDDVIVLATGEKANPLILETMLSETPGVKSVVAFGENRFNLGVSIQPVQPLEKAEEEEAFKNAIWPVIVAAGHKMDAYSRIPSKDAIVLIPASTTIPRTDKGSIPRKEVYALLEAQINAVYEKLARGVDESIEPLKLATLEQDLKSLVQSHTRLQAAPDEWTIDDSLFDLGLDSLQGLQLRRALLAAANKTPALKGLDIEKFIPPAFLYMNPSVREMAAALKAPGSSDSSNGGDLAEAAAEVDRFVEQFSLTQDSATTAAKQPSTPDNAVVLLTGSSGSLGSHVLASLARNSSVQRVVVLQRKKSNPATASTLPTPPPAFDRTPLTSRGIALEADQWAKIVVLEADPSAEQLGVHPFAYTMLQTNITHMVHAAWPMNYLMRLPSFQTQFRFLQNLLQLAVSSKAAHKPRIVFVSSIAAVAKIALETGKPVQEIPVDSAQAACGIGYADGKLVCEKMLEAATEMFKEQIEVTSVRCGQMTGARQTGVWNAAEQIPMVLRSAQTVGCLPRLEGSLSWMPVDDAAAVVSEVLFNTSSNIAGNPIPLVQHLENPVRQPWSEMIEVLGTDLQGINKPAAPFEEWLELVAAAGENGADEESVPVKKLADFFRDFFRPMATGLVQLDTKVAQGQSSTLKNSVAVGAEEVRKSVKYWEKIGYLRKN